MRRIFSLIFLFFCTQYVCADYKFLGISDIHYGNFNQPGDGKDTDPKLLAAAMKKFSYLSAQADFIITLGDFPAHTLLYSEKTATNIKEVFHQLYLADSSNKPMFYVVGNNDAPQGNYQPFSSQGKSPLSLATDWQGACAHCKGLMIDDSHSSDKGYYSTYVMPQNMDIILIALNTIQFTKRSLYQPRYPILEQEKDAQQQLQWLEEQLKTHKSKLLLIAMHIPPGNDYHSKPYWHEAYLKKFMSLLNQNNSRYGEVNLLMAHTHMDDLRKLYLDKGKVIYAYSIPSISRTHRNNPGMKVFEINQKMSIKNYTTYYTLVDDSWGNDNYSAVNDTHPIFPTCHQEKLSACLESLSDGMVCNNLTQGLFYGVKSPRVHNGACYITYAIQIHPNRDR